MLLTILRATLAAVLAGAVIWITIETVRHVRQSWRQQFGPGAAKRRARYRRRTENAHHTYN